MLQLPQNVAYVISVWATTQKYLLALPDVTAKNQLDR